MSAKAKRYQEIANKADFHKRVEKVIYDVSQGRKFTKEYGFKRAIQ